MLVGIKLHIHLCVCSFCLFLQNNVFCQILGTGSVLPDWRTSQPDPNLPHNSNVWYFLFAKFCSDIQIACRALKDFLFFILLFRLCHHPHFVFFFLYPWASFTLHSDVTNKPILQFESFLWNELKWSQYGLWQWCRELNGSETKALGAKGRMKWHKSLSILTPVLLQHYLLFLGHFCFNGSVRPCLFFPSVWWMCLPDIIFVWKVGITFLTTAWNESLNLLTIRWNLIQPFIQGAGVTPPDKQGWKWYRE